MKFKVTNKGKDFTDFLEWYISSDGTLYFFDEMEGRLARASYEFIVENPDEI